MNHNRAASPLPSELSSMSEDPIVSALRPYSTCDVSDALLKLGVTHGGFLSNITMWSPKRQEGNTKIIGPAYTVKYERKVLKPKQPPTHYIDSIPPGSIIFISAPSETINAVYGGLMTARAKASGVIGTIIDGRLRDLQEHRDLDFPVFAKDVGTTAPQESLCVCEINTRLRLRTEHQNTSINPSDYLIADLNGVVCIPRELVEKVLALIPSQVEADERIKRDLLTGRTFVEAAREWRAGVKGGKDV
ncbi:MAG: hypothetical protein HETSPECPRED_006730 [Heterodermia speciosa]|uniref:Uncharacterized protein n=1 Tax=Heterodermia speciosa TaxID=116794 RepID=A0A8H3FUH0_9LECA|nr:MAG: hypothetical protein HETSPECPRED_006730 [Heterodermia speciosa]